VAQDQKGARAKSAWLVFFDESGISLIPPVRRTWSRRGTTPVLRYRMAWKRASMAAALGYWPDGSKARLCFHVQQDAYDTDSLIGVLEQLAGFYRGQRVLLLWDGLSSHWSYRMRAHLDAQRDWLTVERLPAYAPELNPVEFLWANLKGVELANFAGDTVLEVADQAQRGIQRVCDSDSRVVGFLAHTGLSLNNSRHPKMKASSPAASTASYWRRGALLSSERLRVERRAGGDRSSVRRVRCGGWFKCRVGGAVLD
jgi:transposase